MTWDADFWNQDYSEARSWDGPPEPLIVERLSGLNPGTAIDLGCGAGINSIWLAKNGWTVTGLDWAENAIALARRAATDAEVEVDFQVADSTKWQPESEYDLVLSSYALPPAGEGRSHLLSAMRTALAPGGVVLVVDWDVSAASFGEWEAADLVALTELDRAFDGLEIIESSVVQVDAAEHGARESSGHEHGDAGHGHDPAANASWPAALIMARKGSYLWADGQTADAAVPVSDRSSSGTLAICT